jgi:hypothetical protein
MAERSNDETVKALGERLSLSSADEQQQPVTLDTLLPELQHRVYSSLLQDGWLSAFKLSISSFALLHAFRSLPHTEFRLPCLRLAGLAKANVPLCVPCAHEPEDWRHAMKTIVELWRQLASIEAFDADEKQKYLRWISGDQTDCWSVRRAIVGVSLLPGGGIKACFQTDGQFQPHALTAVHVLFDRADHNDRVSAMENFSFERFERLLRWLAGGLPPEICCPERHTIFFGERSSASPVFDAKSSRRRLRLLMAEYNQILCRGLSYFVERPLPQTPGADGVGVAELDELVAWARSHSFRTSNRQFGAFCQICQMATCDDGVVDYWA